MGKLLHDLQRICTLYNVQGMEEKSYSQIDARLSVDSFGIRCTSDTTHNPKQKDEIGAQLGAEMEGQRSLVNYDVKMHVNLDLEMAKTS